MSYLWQEILQCQNYEGKKWQKYWVRMNTILIFFCFSFTLDPSKKYAFWFKTICLQFMRSSSYQSKCFTGKLNRLCLNPAFIISCWVFFFKFIQIKRHHKHVHLDHRPHGLYWIFSKVILFEQINRLMMILTSKHVPACLLCEYRTYSKHNLRLHTSRRHGSY